MRVSSMFTSLLPLALLVPSLLAAPLADAPVDLERRLPPVHNDPDSCAAGLVDCGSACCSAGSSCTANGLCKPPPPPPPPIPGKISVTYTVDPKGRPCVINIHGSGFNTTSDLEIQMVETNFISNPWSKLRMTAHSFDFNTGWCDCTKTGRRTSATDGNPANVFAWDDAWIATQPTFDHLPGIPVRVTSTGVCP
ncbi:hypothetical protein EJ06DRAFT_553911 [Trichodelitschia bisporula]|uniref:Uncharacterized protein n=1 Tax=Trichodelitschia bisporula TaxID=703511 RepID=A0A6G1I639_9PEZI|nr:hypothetical protein EJ06DRAFT_553911 [Trichodelitschia bisporula]